jgi:hypothetical protein
MDLSQSRIPRVVLSLVALAAVAAAASCGSEGSTAGQALGPAVNEVTAAHRDDRGKGDDDRGHGRDHDRGRTFRARLCGYEETPAVSTSGSGRFAVTVRHDGTLAFKLTYRDLVAPVAVAHIHFGAPGTAGGVSAFLCGGGGKPACPQPPATIEGTIVAADVVGPAAQGIAAGELDELVHALRNGLTYANVHSETFPAGEIRGQILGHDGHGKRGHGHGRAHDRGAGCHECLPCLNVDPPDTDDGDDDMDGGGDDGGHDHHDGDDDEEPTET